MCVCVLLKNVFNSAIKKLKRVRCNFLGRIKQLIEENMMTTQFVRLLVLDEADRLKLQPKFLKQYRWSARCTWDVQVGRSNPAK